MIKILDNQDCCGCGACAQKCPKQCISFHEDNEGFLYPHVDADTCIDCGLCEKACPMLTPYENCTPLQVFAAINKEEKVRMESSSGGIFTLLAEKVINEGGVVFGARFDDEWQVTLDYTESIEGLASFRGSKYVQARTSETYKQCEQFLKAGRKVLFTGTPCQISGLHHYLRKQYDNLTTCDFVCHGTPSPKVWGLYLDMITRNIRAIQSAGFRGKQHGWKNFSMHFQYDKNGESISFVSPMQKDMYMRAFLNDLILRPSCHDCKVKNCSSMSDITIADFWGVQNIMPEMDDDKGTSLIMIHTVKGESCLTKEQLILHDVSYEDAVRFNSACCSSSRPHPFRSVFFERLRDDNLIDLIAECTKPPYVNPIRKFVRRCKGFIHRALNAKWGG